MAFTAKWITAAGTVILSDGNPYKMDGGTGLGAADVRNLWERGPQQHGVSDLGYRIDPRTLTFPIFFAGTSQPNLDSRRDTLQTAFSPRAALGTLQITRDDGEVRELYARRAGPLDMPLVPAQRTGKLHKTVVQLFAPDPVWTEPTAGSVSFLSPASWWLAFNTIGSANVLEHTEAPTQGQAWTYTGTITAGSPYFIAIRSGKESNATTKYAWSLFDASDPTAAFLAASNTYFFEFNDINVAQGTAIMTAGTHNYFFCTDGAGWKVYRDATLIASDTVNGNGALAQDTRRWRSQQDGVSQLWTESLPRAAVFNINPTAAQVGALNTAMEAGGSVYNVSLAYPGNLPEYPVVRINGPISDPVLTNTTTGEKLDFTGYSIGSADFYTVDLRYGFKTVKNSGGDNKIGQLSNDSDLASFHIAPAPVAAGGTNVFSLAGTATSGNTSALITYYNRFESW